MFSVFFCSLFLLCKKRKKFLVPSSILILIVLFK